nr:MAG TPA: hypothetical protein [Caudoviricetes sp.]
MENQKFEHFEVLARDKSNDSFYSVKVNAANIKHAYNFASHHFVLVEKIKFSDLDIISIKKDW